MLVSQGFQLWAQKLSSLLKDNPVMTQPQLVSHLAQKGLKYHGSLVNKTMLLAAQSLAPLLEDR